MRTKHSFNTQPPEGGWLGFSDGDLEVIEFQHTAARRRLAIQAADTCPPVPFQHTAARRRLGHVSEYFVFLTCFNTQPPEGGWLFGSHGWHVAL
nr:MAG TPA: hypothetical protein [Herelleviridae sp.]